MQGWVIAAVISFLIRQIGKYGESLDWDKLKADTHARIDDLLPKWLEPAFESLADSILDVVKEALSKQDDLIAIAQDVANGDLPGVFKRLSALVSVIVHPSAGVALSGLQSLIDESEKTSEAKSLEVPG